MTTMVTVDAHAGWDVEVKIQDLNSAGEAVSETTEVVAKNTKQNFFVHSHKAISSIKELPNS